MIFYNIFLLIAHMTENKKMREMLEIAKRIKSKTEEARENTGKLRLFNVKLKALLTSLDAYSTEIPLPQTRTIQKSKVPGMLTRAAPVTEERRENKQNLQLGNRGLCDRLFSKENSKVQRISKEMLTILEEEKKIMLDDMVRRVKMSKYKVIEILNAFVKESIITKRFNKGFIYELVE